MHKEEEPIHQRLNLLVATLADGVQRRFAQRIGVSSGVVGDLFGQRKGKPSFDLLGKILTAYPELRAEWLLLGEGEMLKSITNSGTGEKNSAPIGDPSVAVAPPAAGQEAVSYSLRRGKRVMVGGVPMRNYELAPSAPTVSAEPEPKPTAAPVGLDLIRQVQQNTEDIKRILALLEPQATPAATPARTRPK